MHPSQWGVESCLEILVRGLGVWGEGLCVSWMFLDLSPDGFNNFFNRSLLPLKFGGPN
jgi:hypothetical protein